MFPKVVSDVSVVTLREAAVLESQLYHLDGVILQVEEDLTLSESVCLDLCVKFSFLEVSFKTKSLDGETGVNYTVVLLLSYR